MSMCFVPCSRCRSGCFNKPGPTSVNTSITARKKHIIRRINMQKPNPTPTWFSPPNTSWQQPNAGDIPVFSTWRELTKIEGVNGSCFGR